MLTCIPQDPTGPSTGTDGEGNLRASLGPLTADDKLMEAVDTYAPTPDVTAENPLPSGS